MIVIKQMRQNLYMELIPFLQVKAKAVFVFKFFSESLSIFKILV